MQMKQIQKIYFFIIKKNLAHLGFNVSVDSAEATEALRRYLTSKKVAKSLII